MKPPRRTAYTERVQAYIDFRRVPGQTCGLWVSLIRNLPGGTGEVCLHGELPEGEVTLEGAMRRVAQALTDRGVAQNQWRLTLGRRLCREVGRRQVPFSYMELSNSFTTRVAELADTLQQEAAGPDRPSLSVRDLRRLRELPGPAPSPRRRSLLVAGLRLPVTVLEPGLAQLHLPTTRVLVFEDTPGGRTAVQAAARRALTRAAARTRHVGAAYPDAVIEGRVLRVAHLSLRLYPQPRVSDFPLDVVRFGDTLVLIDSFDTQMAESNATRRAEVNQLTPLVTPGGGTLEA